MKMRAPERQRRTKGIRIRIHEGHEEEPRDAK
jgi:hypothetical protein